MRQINRYGIEIDVCPTSGGVWLDRGELEKIMAILKEEEAVGIAPAPAFPEKRQRDRGYDDDRYKRDYDDDDYYKHKKKSKASKLMDIFDF
jgi:hypothetical protein